ncbi:MAG: hypothetical protein Q9164_006296 [Protoblastenia rupestris]
MNRLPTEILREILLYLDATSLLNLRLYSGKINAWLAEDKQTIADHLCPGNDDDILAAKEHYIAMCPKEVHLIRFLFIMKHRKDAAHRLAVWMVPDFLRMNPSHVNQFNNMVRHLETYLFILDRFFSEYRAGLVSYDEIDINKDRLQSNKLEIMLLTEFPWTLKNRLCMIYEWLLILLDERLEGCDSEWRSRDAMQVRYLYIFTICGITAFSDAMTRADPQTRLLYLLLHLDNAGASPVVGRDLGPQIYPTLEPHIEEKIYRLLPKKRNTTSPSLVAYIPCVDRWIPSWPRLYDHLVSDDMDVSPFLSTAMRGDLRA